MLTLNFSDFQTAESYDPRTRSGYAHENMISIAVVIIIVSVVMVIYCTKEEMVSRMVGWFVCLLTILFKKL